MRSFHRILVVVFLVLLAVLGALGYVTHRVWTESMNASGWVAHTHAVLSELDRTRELLSEGLADQRSYLLSGDPAYLDGFHRAQAEAPKSVDALASLTLDNPAQQERIPLLREAMRQTFEHLSQTAEIRNQAGSAAALQFMLRGGSQQTTERTQQLLTDMRNEELRLLNARTVAAQAGMRSTARALVVLGITVAVLLGTAYALVVREFARRRRAMAALAVSEHRFRLLIGSVSEYAIFMLDEKGFIRTWNHGAQRLKGYTANEIIGKHFSIFFPPEEVARGKCDRELEVAAREGRCIDEGWRARKDGSRFWALVTLSAIHDETGALIGFAKVTRDLTQQKQAEEERVRLAQATEALKMRDEFLSIAAHELRTPLTPLTLQLQRIGRTLRSGTTADPSLVDRASRQVVRLRLLVEELLEFTRLQEGRFTIEREPIDLVQLATQVVDDFRNTSAHELSITAPQPVVVSGDSQRLERVLVNLVQNAIKYSPQGGHVDVTVTRDGGEARVSVADQGIGIPKEEQEQVFQRFFRGGNVATQNFGGLGLGLYLSHQIIEQHDGRFEVQSEPGKGSTFTFRLPLAETQSEAGGPAARPPAGDSPSTTPGL